jgi:hypothetical protein
MFYSNSLEENCTTALQELISIHKYDADEIKKLPHTTAYRYLSSCVMS